MTWKEKVDPTIRTHLGKQIAESMKDREAYESASSPSNAQLWIAIANLSKELFNLNLKINYIEKALKDLSKKKTKQKTSSEKKSKPKKL